MANCVDPDEIPHFLVSHPSLYCLLRPVCPNTYCKYGSKVIQQFLDTTLGSKLYLQMQKLLTFFSKNFSIYAIFNGQSFNDTLTNDIVSFEQLGPAAHFIALDERGFQINIFLISLQKI